MKYDAFISYSSNDAYLAQGLRIGLHRLAKPWFKLRAMNVYLDKTNVSATPSLWATIEEALFESRFLVFFASPLAAKSVWVTKEIEWWLENRSIDSVIVVLTEGHLEWNPSENVFGENGSTVFPLALSTAFESEPRYEDLRWVDQDADLSLKNNRFRKAALKIAAPIRGSSLDEIDGEDVRQLRWTRVIASAALVVMTILFMIAIWQWQLAEHQRVIAERKSAEAQSRSLVLESRNARQTGSRLEESLLLAIEASELIPSYEANQELVAGLDLIPNLKYRLQHSEQIQQMISDRAGQQLVTLTDCSNTVRLWDIDAEEISHISKYRGQVISVAATTSLKKVLVISKRNQFKKPCMVGGVPLGIGPDDDQGYEVSVWKPLTGEISTILTSRYRPQMITMHPTKDYFAMVTGTLVELRGLDGAVIETFKKLKTAPHSGPRNAKFSEGGKYLAVSHGPEIQMWNLDTFNLIWRKSIDELVDKGSNYVKHIGFDSDDERFAVTSEYALLMMDSETGKAFRDPMPHNMAVDVSFSPDSDWVSTSSMHEGIRVSNIESWQSYNIPHTGARQQVFAVNNLLATSGVDQTTRIWSPGLSKELARIPHQGHRLAPVFLGSGDQVVTTLGNQALIWESTSGPYIFRKYGDFNDARFLDSDRVILLGGSRFVIVGRPPWKTVSDGTRGHLSPSRGIDAKVENSEIKVRDLLTGKTLRLSGFSHNIELGSEIEKDKEELLTLFGIRDHNFQEYNRLRTLAFSKSGQVLITATADNMVQVWDVTDGEKLSEVELIGRPSNAMFSNDEGVVMIQTEDYYYVFDTDTGKLLGDLANFEPESFRNKIGPLGHHILIEHKGAKKLVRIKDAAVIWSIPTHQHRPEGDFTIDGQHYLDVDKSTVNMWSAESEIITKKFVHDEVIRKIELSANGNFISTISENNKVSIWSLQSGELLASRSWGSTIREALFGINDSFIVIVVERIVNQPDLIFGQSSNSRYASELRIPGVSQGGTNKFSQVWDWGEDALRLSYPGWAKDISDDDKYLLTTNNTMASIWSLDISHLIDAACGRVTRNLTDEEWKRVFGDVEKRATCVALD